MYVYATISAAHKSLDATIAANGLRGDGDGDGENTDRTIEFDMGDRRKWENKNQRDRRQKTKSKNSQGKWHARRNGRTSHTDDDGQSRRN